MFLVISRLTAFVIFGQCKWLEVEQVQDSAIVIGMNDVSYDGQL